MTDGDDQEKYIISLLLNHGNTDLEIHDTVDDPSQPSGKRENNFVVKVSKYIVSEIKDDDIVFDNKLYNSFLESYASYVLKETEIDLQVFHNSKDPEISALSVDLLSK